MRTGFHDNLQAWRCAKLGNRPQPRILGTEDAITVAAELPGSAASSHAEGKVSGPNRGRRSGVLRAWARAVAGCDGFTPRAQAGFAWYPARNIRVALSTTSVIRCAEGAGAAWKINGMNSDA